MSAISKPFGSGPRRKRENQNAFRQNASLERKDSMQVVAQRVDPHTTRTRDSGPGDPDRACQLCSGATPIDNKDALQKICRMRSCSSSSAPMPEPRIRCVESRLQKLLILQKFMKLLRFPLDTARRDLARLPFQFGGCGQKNQNLAKSFS